LIQKISELKKWQDAVGQKEFPAMAEIMNRKIDDAIREYNTSGGFFKKLSRSFFPLDANKIKNVVDCLKNFATLEPQQIAEQLSLKEIQKSAARSLANR